MWFCRFTSEPPKNRHIAQCPALTWQLRNSLKPCFISFKTLSYISKYKDDFIVVYHTVDHGVRKVNIQSKSDMQ